ncbi:glutathione S-transferase N-terminal domain-containing protein [Bradyrhizobium aeschynomenes]|uniref:glutathione S-transferase N-terminal domain-containing protein n=1 Tax=Bradyrhizobium aeschynomenes TaxID=2734909 RepID=UPI001FEF2533|nr:glutathione S-transferase N-terminal domain-containing protein [Bradyrhizobium aeschynomenes]
MASTFAGLPRRIPIKLYSFWRSLASFRVRIALNLKGVAYEQVAVDVDRQQQRDERYAALNPQMALTGRC